MKAIIIGLLVFVGFYLAGCFISVSFNIALWSEPLREFVGFAGGLVSSLVIFALFKNDE